MIPRLWLRRWAPRDLARQGGARGTTDSPPTVVVAICTRDRPADLRRAIASVLRSDFCDFQLLIVDQSMGPRTRCIVERFLRVDRRIRYLPSDSSGLSVSRNIAMVHTSAELVVVTDDDCVVARDWLGAMVRAFEPDERVGLAFGEVVPAPTDGRDGFIVGYHIEKHRRLRGKFAKLRDHGIGANMAVRSTAFRAVGGFDEALGAGGHFPSSAEGDFAYRVLKAGYAVHHLPQAKVLHYGFRDWASGPRLARNTYVGVAAAYVKHVRCGDPFGAFLVAQEIWFALANLGGRLLKRRRPFGFRRLTYLLLGIFRSFEREVDCQSCLYR